MSEYTFSTLAPNEFEDLSKDLLERHLNVRLQAFTTGRDGGIDLRHAPIAGQDWIVQCKHYAGSRFADLKRSVSNEVEKLHRLKPGRYVLSTSCGLTPGNVDDLFDILSPYCTSTHDIIGKSDLNAILRANGDIERRHPKLWITSEAVLIRVLQNDVFVQSEMTRDSILRRLSLYVYTARFEDARGRLNADRVCIISGVPGVGKTTLAEMLLLEHLMDGWEVVTIHQNISEGLRALKAHPEAKQVFYYDDFLGQISSGEKLAKNEDGAILQLLRAAQHSHTKRFILTTREYILTQAKRQHEKLARAGLDIYRFVVECQDYDGEAKARILANHLYFNDVPQEYIAAIVQDQGYREIIEHDNYNPRLIESMTSRMEYELLEPENYLEAFVSRLNDPSELWGHIYEEQLSEASRHVLLALSAIGAPARLSMLEQDFDVLFGSRCREFGWDRRTTDFERSLNELEGDFIRIRDRGDQRVVEWYNPSVLDFLCSWLKRHRHDVEALLVASRRFDQIEQLMTTMPVLISSNDSGPILQREAVLADAISRTILKADNDWGELFFAFWLCERYTQGVVREVTRERASKVFSSLEVEPEGASSVLRVLNEVEQQNWVSAQQVKEWITKAKRCILSQGHECVDEVDKFIQVSKWVVGKRDMFSESEFAEFQEQAKEFVSHEATVLVSPNTEAYWIGVREGVEQLQGILAQDFRNVIEALERKIENGDKPEPSEQHVSERITRPVEGAIDSIFDALLDGR